MSSSSSSSRFGVALLFAYLAVRPTSRVSTADGGYLAPKNYTTQVKVESVAQGDLTAKMQAKNECESSRQWRVLFGFYVTAAAWKKCVRCAWTKCTETGDWEVCVREGLKLARKHGKGAVVYVSVAAQCRPESPLLSSMQKMLRKRGDGMAADGLGAAKEGRHVVPTSDFWKLVGSRRSTKWVNQQLRRFSNVV